MSSQNFNLDKKFMVIYTKKGYPKLKKFDKYEDAERFIQETVVKDEYDVDVLTYGKLLYIDEEIINVED